MKCLVVGCGTIGEPTAAVIEGYHGPGSALRHDPAKGLGVRRGEASRCDYVIFCLPTPGAVDGSPAPLDTRALDEAVEEWAEKLDQGGPTFVVRSTTPVGWCDATAAKINRPVLHWPEFSEHWRLREFLTTPPFFVVGARDGDAAEDFVVTVLPWYAGLSDVGATIALLIPTAASELAKLWTNVTYAATMVLANEGKAVGDGYGVKWDDVRQVLDANPRLGDTFVVTSEGGYGGACLPKDVGHVAADVASRGGGGLHKDVGYAAFAGAAVLDGEEGMLLTQVIARANQLAKERNLKP